MIKCTCDLCGRETDNTSHDVEWDDQYEFNTVVPGSPKTTVIVEVTVALNNARWHLCPACAFQALERFVAENKRVDELFEENNSGI